jgi:hypothetical protein
VTVDGGIQLPVVKGLSGSYVYIPGPHSTVLVMIGWVRLPNMYGSDSPGYRSSGALGARKVTPDGNIWRCAGGAGRGQGGAGRQVATVGRGISGAAGEDGGR